MISWAMLPKKPSISSMACCMPPGLSTDSRSRTATKNVSSTSATITSMLKALVIGVAGCFGWTPIACSNARTPPPKTRLSSAVNHSCSMQNPDYKCFGSVPSAHGGVGFKARLRQQSRNRSTQPKQESPKGLRRTCEYNIGGDSRQKVAQKEARNQRESMFGPVCIDNAAGQSLHRLVE